MTRTIWLKIRLLSTLSLLLIVVHFMNISLDGELLHYGIIPRSYSSWYHIFLSPFIHGSFMHLANNLVGLMIFSAICLLRSIRFYIVSSLFIITVGGALVWFFARGAIHVGASGWIFGLWSLVIATALFDRRFINIVIAVVVVFLYGGMIYGIFPSDPSVSFEAHLFGVIAGVLCAFLHKTIGVRVKRKKAGFK